MNNTWWDKVSIHNIEYKENPNDKSFPIFWTEWPKVITDKDIETCKIINNITIYGNKHWKESNYSRR